MYRLTYTSFLPSTALLASMQINSLQLVGRTNTPNLLILMSPGMVMALNILAESTKIQVAAGYESGHTMVFVQNDPGAPFQKLYSANPHTQPGQSAPSYYQPIFFPLRTQRPPPPRNKTPSNPTPSPLHNYRPIQRPLHHLLCRRNDSQAPSTNM